jgi:hypothetical protein
MKACLLKIFPTSYGIPANVLRFHVFFSSPMRRGFAHDLVQLEEDDGREWPALLRLDAELWNRRHTVLTLLVHPGRLKSGIGAAHDRRFPFLNGKRYRLVIRAGWPSQRGSRLERAAEKRFRAGPPQVTQLQGSDVRLTIPPAGSTDWLKVRFDRPLDWAHLRRAIAVLGSRDELLPGQRAVRDSEREWWFRPSAPWSSAGHRLLVDHRLEDSCGNAFERPFEGPPADAATGSYLVLPFTPRRD